MNIKNILKGHVNELLNRNEDLFNQRMEICNKCPLMSKEIIGKVCSRKIYINIETNETSIVPTIGFVHGCGCRLDAKTRGIENECPIGKW